MDSIMSYPEGFSICKNAIHSFRDAINDYLPDRWSYYDDFGKEHILSEGALGKEFMIKWNNKIIKEIFFHMVTCLSSIDETPMRSHVSGEGHGILNEYHDNMDKNLYNCQKQLKAFMDYCSNVLAVIRITEKRKE